MARLLSTLAALPLALCIATPLAAQSQAALLGDFELNLKATQDVVSGETFHADGDYLSQHGKPEAAPFFVVVPLAGNGDYESRVVETPRTGLVKFVFATPGGGLIESVTFSEMSLPVAEEEPRLEYLVELLNTEVLPGLANGKTDASRANIRKTEVGGVPGVEAFGTYTHADYGKMHWRVVALPKPDAEAGVVALAQISEEAVPITSPNEYPASLSGRVIESFSFE